VRWKYQRSVATISYCQHRFKTPAPVPFCSQFKNPPRRGCGIHSKIVSKILLGLGPVTAVRFGERQMAIHLVDGARSFRCAYDLDRGTERDCRLNDTVNAQMYRPTALNHPAHATASVNASSLSSGEDLDIRRCADSTLPVPADGAGGPRLR
jgi:hypothetical protein